MLVILKLILDHAGTYIVLWSHYWYTRLNMLVILTHMLEHARFSIYGLYWRIWLNIQFDIMLWYYWYYDNMLDIDAHVLTGWLYWYTCLNMQFVLIYIFELADCIDGHVCNCWLYWRICLSMLIVSMALLEFGSWIDSHAWTGSSQWCICLIFSVILMHLNENAGCIYPHVWTCWFYWCNCFNM